MKPWILILVTGALLTTVPSAGDRVAEQSGTGTPASSQPPGTAQDEQAIRRVIAAVFDAANRRDAKAGTLLFTHDADFVNVLGMWWKGAAEIEREWSARFNTGLKSATFKVVDIRISFLKQDVALAHVTSEITGFVSPDGQPVVPHNERSLRVLTREDNEWRVRAFHNTTVAASVPPRKQ
jgi:uncharacterized protein (TIGR02246 family)